MRKISCLQSTRWQTPVEKIQKEIQWHLKNLLTQPVSGLCWFCTPICFFPLQHLHLAFSTVCWVRGRFLVPYSVLNGLSQPRWTLPNDCWSQSSKELDCLRMCRQQCSGISTGLYWKATTWPPGDIASYFQAPAPKKNSTVSLWMK